MTEELANDAGRSLRDGLSPSVEPASGLAGSAASIPSADAIPPLRTQIFMQCDYGVLGSVSISLPECNGGDEQFEADFDDVLSFVATIMMRRKKARASALKEREVDTPASTRENGNG